MGWSCRAEAADEMDAWSEACRSEGGSSNSYTGKDGVERFIQMSRKEHDDGAITGTIYKYLSDGEHVRANGSFRINGDGTVAKYPASWPYK